MSGNKAYICGMGAVTPLGLDAPQTAASVRAGLSRKRESAICGKHFDPMVLSLLPDENLPELTIDVEETTGLTSRQMRLLRLAAPAMAQALSGLRHTERIPLLLGCPEPLPGRPPAVGDGFIHKLVRQAGVSMDLANSEVYPQGRAAGLIALETAMARIEEGAPYVLVGGVDTYLDAYLLGALDSENRILGPRAMDGFIPGEGAGFVLMGTVPPVGRAPLPVIAAARGFEEGHLYSDQPYRGNGLADTLLSLFAAMPESPKVKTVFAGLNGEHFGAKEWGVATLRHADRFEEQIRLEHPVDCLGDPGAALGPLLIMLAAVGLQNGYVQGPCLAWCSSDQGSRAAAAIHKE